MTIAAKFVKTWPCRMTCWCSKSKCNRLRASNPSSAPTDMTIVLAMPPVNPFSARHTATWSFVTLALRPDHFWKTSSSLFFAISSRNKYMPVFFVSRKSPKSYFQPRHSSTLPSKIFGSVDFSGKNPFAADTVTPAPAPTASNVSTLVSRLLTAAE